MRRYPGDHNPRFYTILVDCKDKLFSLIAETKFELKHLEAILEDHYKQDRRKTKE